MGLLKRGRLRLLLNSIVVLGLLWMLFPKTVWDPALTLTYRWMDYTLDDDIPENECNCSAIIQGESEALEQAKLLGITKDYQKRLRIPNEYYINATQDCRKFLSLRKYLTLPSSQEEQDFPLAYSLVVHHKVQSFERLLRAIYAPQNFYCVHVDKKADSTVFSAIMGITSCFPNVFIASKAETVVYAAWPRVQADINCMAELYNISTTWKYFINLCGQDFPLKTNLEIVRTLQLLKGQNSLESEKMPEPKKWRWQRVHQVVNGNIQGTGQRKDTPPFNLTIMSGNAYIVVNRGYIRAVLEDKRVQALLEWAKDTYSPDEFLWATIQRIPGVPGSTWPNYKYDLSDVNAFARLVKWIGHEGLESLQQAVYPPCKGKYVREICVFGAGDLQWIIKQHHFFANKFDIDSDPIALYCLEKYLRQKTLAESYKMKNYL